MNTLYRCPKHGDNVPNMIMMMFGKEVRNYCGLCTLEMFDLYCEPALAYTEAHTDDEG